MANLEFRKSALMAGSASHRAFCFLLEWPLEDWLRQTIIDPTQADYPSSHAVTFVATPNAWQFVMSWDFHEATEIYLKHSTNERPI